MSHITAALPTVAKAFRLEPSDIYKTFWLHDLAEERQSVAVNGIQKA